MNDDPTTEARLKALERLLEQLAQAVAALRSQTERNEQHLNQARQA